MTICCIAYKDCPTQAEFLNGLVFNSSNFFLFLHVSSCFFLFLPVSSCFYLFSVSSCFFLFFFFCFLLLLTISYCFFLLLPVSFSIIQFLPVFGVFFSSSFSVSSCLFMFHLVFPVSSSLFFKFNSWSLALIALALIFTHVERVSVFKA